MAAGFITKPLATLLATAARWVEFGDASTAPVHGSIQLDPTTGLALDLTLPVEVSSSSLATAANQVSLNGQIETVGGVSVFATSRKLFKTSPLTRSAISITGTTATDIVTAVASQTIRIHVLRLQVSAATTLTFRDGSGGTLFETMAFSAADRIELPFSEVPYYVSSAGASVTITSSNAVTITGRADFVRTV